MAPRVLTSKLIHVQPAREAPAHTLTCPHCIRQRIRERKFIDRMMSSSVLQFKGVIILTIAVVKTMTLLLVLSVPLVVLLAASMCCGSRKNKSALEEGLEHMTAMSPRALAARMPEAPTSLPTDDLCAQSPTAIAHRTRLRRRSKFAS